MFSSMFSLFSYSNIIFKNYSYENISNKFFESLKFSKYNFLFWINKRFSKINFGLTTKQDVIFFLKLDVGCKFLFLLKIS